MRKTRFLVAPLLFAPLLGVCQPDWSLRKDENGIRIYTRDVPGAAMKATKAETVFDAPVPTCISVLKDVNGFTKLFPNCTYAEAISTSGDTVQLQYIRLDAPWPVTDRDYAFEYRYRHGKEKGAVHVHTACLPKAYPPDPSMIRLDKGEGLWVFSPTGDGKTRLVYEFHGSPGGTVPAWLANTSVVDSPMQMLKNFHQLVKDPRFKGKQYNFGRN